MFTNELKKGDMVMLKNGWKAKIEDNLRGNTRLATVYGLYTEMGSVYSHDIDYKINGDGSHESMELTPSQAELKDTVKSYGF